MAKTKNGDTPLPKRLKLYTLSSAKKKAWDEFSNFIRTRDCIKTTKSLDYGYCYTCGRIYPFKELQAGHFVAGRGNSVLFDEMGVKAQCIRCNILKGGEPLLYRRRLVEELGKDIVSAMEDKRWRVKKYSIPELNALQIYYKKAKEKLIETYFIKRKLIFLNLYNSCRKDK